MAHISKLSKIVFAVALNLSTLPHASAQFRDLYNKAKKKVQDAVTTTTTGQTDNNTWFTYCKATTASGIYYTTVFPYDHSSGLTLFNRIIPAWQGYAAKLGLASAKDATCSSNASGPASRKGDQTMLKLRNDDMEAERHYSEETGSQVKPLETNWTYNGATAVSSPDSSASPTTSTPSSATEQRRAMPRHAGQSTTVAYWYCSTDTREPTIYFSAPFESTDGNAATQGFLEYLKQTYGYHSGNLPPCFGNHPDLNATQNDEQQRISGMKSSNKWKVIETGWAPNASMSGNQVAPKQLTPDDEVSVAIGREHKLLPQRCQENATLGGIYDCSCFADKVTAKRTEEGASIAKAAGEKLVLSPSVDKMVITVDLRTCVVADKVTNYVMNTLKSGSLTSSYSPEKQQAVGSCILSKLTNQLKSDPQGQRKVDMFYMNDSSACNLLR